MWLLIALGGYTIAAIVAVLDKFIVSNQKMAPALVSFYTAIPGVLIFLLLPFRVRYPVSTFDWLMALVAGLAFLLAMWAMFIGFEESEVSHVGPLLGAATAVFVAVFGPLFLGERLAGLQYGGIALLVVGSLLISFEKSQLHSGWHRGLLWGITSGLLFAISHVASKYIYNQYGFFSGLVWTRGLLGLCGAALILHPAVWPSIFGRRPDSTLAPQPRVAGTMEPASTISSQSKVVIFVSDKVLGIGGGLVLQYAMAIGSVTVVNALGGVQYGLLIILVAVLSRFYPKLFKEEYTRGEGLQEAVAVLLIALGMGMLVM